MALVLHLEELPIRDRVGGCRNEPVGLGSKVQAVDGPQRDVVLEEVAVVGNCEGHRGISAGLRSLQAVGRIPARLLLRPLADVRPRGGSRSGRRRRGREGARDVLRAEERHVVGGVGGAEDEPHSVVVGVAVHARALIMHGLHKVRLAHGPLAALPWRFWRRWTAVVLDLGVGRRVAGRRVAPVAEGELGAGAVAAHHAAARRVLDLQAQRGCAGIADALAARAGGEREPRAVHHGAHTAAALSRGTPLGHLELEGQSPAINQADVHPVRGAVRAEARLELRVDGRRAADLEVAGLARASALAQQAAVALAAAAHLGPVAGAREARGRLEGEGLTRRQAHILTVGPYATGGHVRDPDRLCATSVRHPQPLPSGAHGHGQHYCHSPWKRTHGTPP
mmetsp:Transcript_41350/g.123583  ORF Transcript_41350/g.123583 Transcript_41350/m.123583 type:complete len:394 (+) Transcript_41350:657-1838(+)